MQIRSLIASVALLSCAGGVAHAATPMYAGTLTTGTAQGTVMAESGSFATPENWSFWQFTAPFMSTVSIAVTPDDPAFDVYFAVWYGLESDTDKYYDMTSGSVNTVFVTSADGGGPFAPDGVGAPAALSFVNDYGNGPFVLAVADYVDGKGVGSLPYTVATAVPEPATTALWLAGLAVTGLLARRRKS